MRDIQIYADPSNSIGYLTRIAFRAFSRALETRTAPYGVSSGQWRFLRVLWREDGLTQRELSRREAKGLQATLLPAVAEVNDIALAGLTASEIDILRRALSRVGRNLFADAGEDAPTDSAV
jgi:MarR family transcriptional regulator for hemolysin